MNIGDTVRYHAPSGVLPQTLQIVHIDGDRARVRPVHGCGRDRWIKLAHLLPVKKESRS